MTLWRRVDDVEGLVALTFDDGDRPGPWAEILEVLAAKGARATFFVLGMRVREHPDLARRTVAEGHAIGSHGWDHARLTGLPPGEVRWRLERDREVWRETAGVDPAPWFRPPFGDFDDSVLGAAAEAGYEHTVLWDVDPEDWREPPAPVLAGRVLEAARAGSIVDLHVVEPTAEALPHIVDGLTASGLRLATVAQLLASGRRKGS